MIQKNRSNSLKTSLFLMFSALSPAFADTQINLSDLDNNSFAANVGSPGSVSTSDVGGTRLVTYNLSNLDLAEDGSANDSLTFTIRVAANGGTVSDFTDTNGSPWGVAGSGGGNSIGTREGLSFSLVSSSFNLGNQGGNIGLAFVGFTGVNSWFANGDLPRLTGAGNAISDVNNLSLIHI